MATTEFTQGTPVRARFALSTVGAGIERLVVAWRAMRNRRSVARLLNWDDRMLRDIGITAGDVRSALAAPLTDDPSYRLGVMSVERRAAFRAAAEERLRRRAASEQKQPVAVLAAARVRSKSETLADAHRQARRVPPHRHLEM